MKKILVTTLALSLAVASTVDAKYISQDGTTAARPAKKARMSRRPVAANAATPASVLQPAKDIMDAKKAQEPMAAPVEDTIAALTNPDMTPEQQELVAKRVKEADLERDIKLKQNEISDLNYGWFGFGTSQETKEKNAQARRDLADLNTELKNVRSRIRELQVSTGKAWSNAVKFGIGALTAAGITAIAYGVDQYKFGGKYTAMVREGYESGSNKAAQLYEDTKAAGRNAMSRTRQSLGLSE